MQNAILTQMCAEPSIGWLMVSVAVWTFAVALIVYAGLRFGGECLTRCAALFRTPQVIDFQQRREQLKAAAGFGRRQ